VEIPKPPHEAHYLLVGRFYRLLSHDAYIFPFVKTSVGARSSRF
jgi:hypothetical protein